MECQECHIRPAALHFTKIINGEKAEVHICEQCAKEKGDFSPGFDGFSIHQLLSGLLGLDETMAEKPTSSTPFQETGELQCSTCGMTYSQFAKTGKFGCAHCYHAFQSELDPVFKRVHGGNTTHKGKVPKRNASHIRTRQEIDELRQQLQQHIQNEEFEKAAEIRDRIYALEKKGD